MFHNLAIARFRRLRRPRAPVDRRVVFRRSMVMYVIGVIRILQHKNAPAHSRDHAKRQTGSQCYTVPYARAGIQRDLTISSSVRALHEWVYSRLMS